MKDLVRNDTEQKIKCLRIYSETNKKNQLFVNLEKERGGDKNLGGIVEGGRFLSFYCSLYLIKHVYVYFSQLTPQTAIFRFNNIDNDTFLVQNHILLLLQLHVYNTRKHGFLSFNNFLNEI